MEREINIGSSDEDLIKNEGPELSHSAISKQDKNEQYSDLLEDSEYP